MWVRSDGNILTVSTGAIERQWKFTKSGLLTTAIRDVGSGRSWTERSPQIECDWMYEGWLDGSAQARAISIRAETSDDEGFTSQHLAVVVELEYSVLALSLKYVIWAYPLLRL